jgi:hypothetical protein
VLKYRQLILSDEKKEQGNTQSDKARKKFEKLRVEYILFNKFTVDKIKTRGLIIKPLFFNFTNVLIRLKSC